MNTNPNTISDLQTALLSAIIIILPVCARMVQQCLELRLAELKVKLDSNTAITKRNEDGLKSVTPELAATRAQIATQSAVSNARHAHENAPTTEPLNP